MNGKQIALWCVLADFVALTGYAMFTEGYFAFIGAAIDFGASGIWGIQILADFLVGLTIALGWCIADARQRNLNYWPFVVLTFTLGAIGPLSYLIHRERVIARSADTGIAQAELQHA